MPLAGNDQRGISTDFDVTLAQCLFVFNKYYRHGSTSATGIDG